MKRVKRQTSFGKRSKNKPSSHFISSRLQQPARTHLGTHSCSNITRKSRFKASHPGAIIRPKTRQDITQQCKQRGSSLFFWFAPRPKTKPKSKTHKKRRQELQKTSGTIPTSAKISLDFSTSCLRRFYTRLSRRLFLVWLHATI